MGARWLRERGRRALGRRAAPHRRERGRARGDAVPGVSGVELGGRIDVDFDHLVGSQKAVADPLLERVGEDWLAKIVDVGDVFGLPRGSSEADLGRTAEVSKNFAPRRFLGGTASVALGQGARSLGHLRPRRRPFLEIRFGKPRLRLEDADLGTLRLPVTDLRLFDPGTGEPRERSIQLLMDRLRRREVVLSVGLTRPWGRDGEEERHWLQINNVHLDGDPLWPG